MRTVLLLLATAVAASACSLPTCQSTCRRYYEEEQCNRPPEGRPREEVIEECVQTCDDALDIPGEAPDPHDPRFDPDRIPTPVKPVLTNEKDVAAWMDCVWTFDDETCEDELGRTVRGSPDSLLAAVAVAVLASGCSPSCESLCKKLERCDLTDGVTLDECEVACTQEADVVSDSDAVEDKASFNDHRACIGSSTCEEIAAGACFDDGLYPFTRG